MDAYRGIETKGQQDVKNMLSPYINSLKRARILQRIMTNIPGYGTGVSTLDPHCQIQHPVSINDYEKIKIYSIGEQQSLVDITEQNELVWDKQGTSLKPVWSVQTSLEDKRDGSTGDARCHTTLL